MNTLVLLKCTDSDTRLHWQRIVVPYDHTSAQFRLVGSGEVAITQACGVVGFGDGCGWRCMVHRV
jgi:hypothetical protein